MKNKVCIFLLFLGFLFSACDEKPKSVLSDEKMAAVMVDLFLFDGAAYVENLSHSDSVKEEYYNQILNKHGISIAEYDSSVVWYLNNMKRYEFIQKEVMSQLKILEKDIQSEKYKRPIAANDSLDSLVINVGRRDLFIVHNSPRNTSEFKVKNTDLEKGDLLKLKFQIRTHGEKNQIKAIASMVVYYADSTKEKQQLPVKVSLNTSTYMLDISIHKDIPVDSVKLNLFESSKPLSFKQRVLIDKIRVQRVYNSYRK